MNPSITPRSSHSEIVVPEGAFSIFNRIYCVVLQLSIKQGACAVFVDYRERQPEFIQREPSQALTT